MYLYRVVAFDNYKDGDLSNVVYEGGLNTFEYDEKEKYIHFFILPEEAEIYQKIEYSHRLKKSVILRCNIPAELLKGNMGVGMYRYYMSTNKEPFLEARLNIKDFKQDMIEEVSSKVEKEWKNDRVYKRYLYEVIYNRYANPFKFDIRCVENLQPEEEMYVLNSKFNFYNYFPYDDLKKEHLEKYYEKERDDFIVKYLKSHKNKDNKDKTKKRRN